MHTHTQICSPSICIILVVAALVLTTGCGDESSTGKTNPAGGSTRPAEPSQPPVAQKSPAVPAPAAASATPGVPETPTLRTSIVGKWVVEGELSVGRGDMMSFTKDGRYEGFAVSTRYTGTYRVIDDHTLELNAASVLSNMQPVKKTLKVDWRNDLLTVKSDNLGQTYVKQK